MSEAGDRISRVEIDNPGVVRYHPDVEREIAVAIYDLVEENEFRPERAHFGHAGEGPYALVLRIQESRLIIDIACEDGAKVGSLPVALVPFRRIIKDYFTVCESYYEAIRSASPTQIEAIDMGRRGLHDEGSDRLRQQLEGRIAIDRATARRLFTLLCALHIRA